MIELQGDLHSEQKLLKESEGVNVGHEAFKGESLFICIYKSYGQGLLTIRVAGILRACGVGE